LGRRTRIPFILLFLFLLLHPIASLALPILINPTPFFNTPRGAIKFADTVTASHVEYSADGWNFTNVNTTRDDKQLSVFWITVDNATLTIYYITHLKNFTAILDGTAGDTAEVKMTLRMLTRRITPSAVYLNGSSVTSASDKTAYDSSTDAVWFWNGTVTFVKVPLVDPPYNLTITWTYSYISQASYSFDGETGSTAYDSSENDNDGVIIGAARNDSGRYGRGLSFGGDGDRVRIPDSSSLDITSEVYLSAWVKTNSSDPQGVICKKDAYGLMILSNYALRAYINTTTLDTEANIISPNTWNHIAMWYNGSLLRIYVNASLVASMSLSGSIATNDYPVWIGNYTTNYFSGELDEVIILADAPPQDDLDDLRDTPIADFPYCLDISISDMDAEEWLLVQKTYTFTAKYVRQNATYPLTQVRFMFTDGAHWTYATYDVTDDEYTFTSTVAYSVEHSVETSGNLLTLTWKIYLDTDILDAKAVDLWGYAVDNASRTFGPYIISADYFNIYSHGGLTEAAATGNAFQVAGGSILDVAAQTSGDYAEVNVTWANLQHFHALVHLYQNASWNETGEYWDCPTNHSRTGWFEYGVYYWFNNTWVEGWKVRLEIIDGRAGTFGADLDEAWVLVNATWYSLGEAVKSEQFYAMYEAYKSTDSSTQVSLWVDLWISLAEGSGKCAGRVAAQYYGVTETGWGGWSSWGPKSGLGSSSSFEDDLKDADGYTIKASQLKLFKVFVRLAKTDPTCDSHQWALLHEDLQWRVLPPSSVLVGLAAPVLASTVMPGQPLGALGSAISALNVQLSGLSSSLGSATQTPYFIMSGIIDSAFNYFGIPDFTTTAYNLISTYAGYFSVSVTYVTTTITPIFNFFADTALFILTWFTRVINTYLQIASIVKGILDGTYSITTGVGSVWEFINIENWMDFIPLIMLISWFTSVDERARRQGGGWVQIFWGDIQIIISVISFIFDWSMRVISLVVDWVFRFIQALPI